MGNEASSTALPYSKKRKNKEKSAWQLAIERLEEEFSPQTFSNALLSFSECRSLSEIMLDGTGAYSSAQKIEARELFIKSNLRLVRQISLGYIKKYPQTPIEDLFQMGVIGLMRAVDKWDPDREFQFSTYATWWIRQSITRAVMDNEALIRIPVHMQEKFGKVLAYEEQYFDFFNITPDPQEASDALEIEMKEYLNIKESIYSFESIQDFSHRNGELKVFASRQDCLDESTSDPAIVVEKMIFIEQLQAVLGGITSREARIISQRYGLVDGIPKTLDEIGKEFGLTRERIRQIESKTMTKLRHPARSLALRDYLDIEDFRREILPSLEKAPWCRVGAEPLN